MALDEERARHWEIQRQLERRIDAHEDTLQHLDTVPATLNEILRRLDAQDRSLSTLASDMANMRTVTNDLRDAQIAGRVLTAVVKWTAAMVVAMGVIWGAFNAVMHPQSIPPVQK